MKTPIICFALVVATLSPASAGTEKTIKKEIVQTTKAIKAACGCTVAFSYSDDFDFTDQHGSSLAYMVEKTIEAAGEEAVHWCKRGDEFAAKLCLMVQSVEVDADDSTKKPYTRAVGRGVVRNFIARKNPKQMTYDSAWVDYFLEHGKMRDRKAEDEP